MRNGPPADPSGGSAATTHYYLDDHLGTAQAELNAWGLPMWQGQFTPFGSELPDGSTTMHYKFTGKERDAESGLDNFGARYYASTTGRWISPDWAAKPEAVPYASLPSPQTLNLYAYVANNPLRQADPDGHDYLHLCSGAEQGAGTCGAGSVSVMSGSAPQQTKGQSQQQQQAQAQQNGVSTTDVKKVAKVAKTTWSDTRAVKKWYDLAARDRDTLYNPNNYNGNVDIDFIRARYVFEFAKAEESLFRFAEDFIATATSASGDPETVLGRLANLGIGEAKYGTSLAMGGYKASFSQIVGETEKAYISAAGAHYAGVEKGWWPADQ